LSSTSITIFLARQMQWQRADGNTGERCDRRKYHCHAGQHRQSAADERGAARANTKGKTGRMQGLMIVIRPPR
jgi:hypothetical protein